MNTVKKIFKTVFLVEIAQGMALTLRTFFSKPVTRQYPTFKRKPIPGSRGLHAMRRDDAGRKERCIGCGLCEAVCPSKAIMVVTTEGPEHEKLVNSYELDLLRCVFCGFCIDACPVSAIVMTPEFELACYERKDAFYTKDRLIQVGDRYLGANRAAETGKAVEIDLPAGGKRGPLSDEPVIEAADRYVSGKAVEK